MKPVLSLKTEIQALHHAEQMDAVRSEFIKDWNANILPTLRGKTEKQIIEEQIRRWNLNCMFPKMP